MAAFRRYSTDALQGRETVLLTGVVLLALASRVAVALLTRSWIFSEADHFKAYGFEMGAIGASIAMGDGFAWPAWGRFPGEPTAWMAPVYPWLVGLAFKAFGVYSEQAAVVLELFQTVVSVLSCVLLYLIGKRVYGPRAGLLAALMFALYPASIHFAVQKIWSTTLFVFCLLAIAYLFMRMADHPSLKIGVTLGALVGFTALLEVTILAVVPFALVWLWFVNRKHGQRVLGPVTAMLLVSGLVILPWLVRNYTVFGHVTFIKSNFGKVFYEGNKDLATSDVSAPQVFLEGENEAQYNRFFLARVVDQVLDHPLQFVERTVVRVANFWTMNRVPAGLGQRIALMVYLGVLLLAIGGLIKSTFNRDLVLVLLFLLALPLVYYITISYHGRYRYPIEPLLMLPAAHFLLVLWRRIVGGSPATVSL